MAISGPGLGAAAGTVGQLLMQTALQNREREERERARQEAMVPRMLQAMLGPSERAQPLGVDAPLPEGARELAVGGQRFAALAPPPEPVEPKLPPVLETSSGIFTRGGAGLEPVIDPVTKKPAMPYRAPPQPTQPPAGQFLQVEGPEGPQFMLGNPRTGTVAPVLGPGGEPIKPKAPTQRRLPATVLSTITSNQNQIRVIDDALRLLEERPEGVGLKGHLPDFMLQRMDPEGVPLRATIGDIGSLMIHDRFGSAQSVGEMKRATPYIPSDKDSPQTARAKLTRLRNLVANETALYEDAMQRYYGVGGGEGQIPSATEPAPPAATPGASDELAGARAKVQGMPPDRARAALQRAGFSESEIAEILGA